MFSAQGFLNSSIPDGRTRLRCSIALSECGARLSSSPVVAGDGGRVRVSRRPAGYRLHLLPDSAVTHVATADAELRPLTNSNTNHGLSWANENFRESRMQ